MFGAMLGGWEMFLILVIVMPVMLLATAFWVWMLVDAIRNKNLSEGEKIGWVLAIVFLHVLAALLYLCLGRSKHEPAAAA